MCKGVLYRFLLLGKGKKYLWRIDCVLLVKNLSVLQKNYTCKSSFCINKKGPVFVVVVMVVDK